MHAFASGMLLPLALLAGQSTPPAPAPATAPSPPPTQQRIDCQDATHRAVGFWVGDWTVLDTASATAVATSRIEWVVNGCAIRETYTQTIGPGGKPVDYRGTSYTAYEPNERQWKQFYVDTSGIAALLVGTVDGEHLVLHGRAGGAETRMTIETEPSGDVRQRGESSADGGEPWTPTFDFTYHKR